MKLFTLLFVFVALNLSALRAQVGFTTSGLTCAGSFTVLVDTSGYADTSITSWAWDLDNDGNYDDAWGKSINYIFGAAGSMPASLEITFNNSTVLSGTQNVQINPLPEVNFYVDNLCEDALAVYTDNSSISTGSIAGYYWDFDNDGNADEVGQSATYYHGDTGTYVSALKCESDAGCFSTTWKQNEVFTKPVSDFNTTGSSMVGEATVFINYSSIPTGTVELYVWDFGDGKGSAVETPSHDWDSAMTYTVQLVTISDQECRDTMLKEIVVAEAVNVELGLGPESEVVTPNGDGINDFLKINGYDLYIGCDVKIYSIWNEEVYANPEYDNTEDASFSGDGMDAGAYYYIITCDDEEVMGIINIMR